VVLSFTDRGIYCEAGDFYIDPWRPVDRALITHGHADHARPGHRRYLSTVQAAPVITHRLGVEPETVRFGEVRDIGGVSVSFHPAGHVPGSAQIRVEHKGEVWVASGDYKIEPDGLSEAFEPVLCDAFITECTFGLPVFNWRPQAEVMADLNGWWRACAAEGKVAAIGAYSLGKAQRIIAGLDTSIGPILTHGAVENTNAVLRAQGYGLPQTHRVTADTVKAEAKGGIVVAPPSALGGAWIKKFGAVSTAHASGWMALRGVRRRRGADRGFVISDHVDWAGMNRAIRETGAERIFVTHGYTSVAQKWLESEGYDARVVETEFEGDLYERDPQDGP